MNINIKPLTDAKPVPCLNSASAAHAALGVVAPHRELGAVDPVTAPDLLNQRPVGAQHGVHPNREAHPGPGLDSEPAGHRARGVFAPLAEVGARLQVAADGL